MNESDLQGYVETALALQGFDLDAATVREVTLQFVRIRAIATELRRTGTAAGAGVRGGLSSMSKRALDIARSIRSGELGAVALIEQTLAGIRRRDREFNCFTELTEERALREAAAIDARRARGEPLPPLAGVPYAVKNLYDIEGIATLAGGKVNAGNPPAAADAALVARLRAAGAVLVGALNMDEHAYGFTTENTHYGATRNPHDTSRIVGGSSGGSAAAVGGRPGAARAGFRHQWLDPRPRVALRRVRLEADLRPAVAPRFVSVRRQPRPSRTLRGRCAGPGGGLRRLAGARRRKASAQRPVDAVAQRRARIARARASPCWADISTMRR